MEVIGGKPCVLIIIASNAIIKDLRLSWHKFGGEKGICRIPASHTGYPPITHWICASHKNALILRKAAIHFKKIARRDENGKIKFGLGPDEDGIFWGFEFPIANDIEMIQAACEGSGLKVILHNT